jgi:hypothetical protein
VSELIIPIEDLSLEIPQVFVGDRPRLSTVTSVILLSPNLMVCSHFNGCKMFVIKFDLPSSTFEVVQELDTTYGGQKCETDLLASDDCGNIVSTNFFKNSCTLYLYENNRIRFARDLEYNAGNRVHGLKFIDKDTIAVTSRHDHSGVHFFDFNTGQMKAVYRTQEISIQDIALTADDIMVMISGAGTPLIRPKQIYSSRASLIRFDIEKNMFTRIKDYDFPSAHFDNVISHENVLYITDQYNNKVIKLAPNDLQYLGELEGYNFPHGIDVRYGLIAVTNYGNNTISIRPLS